MTIPAQRERFELLMVIGAGLALLAIALYAYLVKNAFIHDQLNDLFWDARVYALGGKLVSQGVDPYEGLVLNHPMELPFISAPAVAWLLGGIYKLVGPGLFWFMAATHVAAMLLVPLMLTRLFLGTRREDALLGFGLFLGTLGAMGVITVLAGNFGATLYMLIFASLIHGLKTGKWLWFHIAVGFALQFKWPYMLFWCVPVMANGWSWRQFRDAAIAAVIATLPFLVSWLIDPAYFNLWLGGLTRQVIKGDVGYSVYGAAFSLMWPDVNSIIPKIAHAVAIAAVGLVMLLDRTRGPARIAGLIVFAILANPRMKEYDMAFAAIPAAALYLRALAPEGSAALRRALALGAVVLLAAVTMKANDLPVMGPFIYAIVLGGALIAMAGQPWLARLMPASLKAA